MSRLDQLVERAAARLEDMSRTAAQDGGFKSKLAEPLADDAAFLRQLKPSLIAARARGEAPTNGRPAEARVPAPRPARERTTEATTTRGDGDGPSPLLVIGTAFAVGMALAHLVDWLGQRYPRS